MGKRSNFARREADFYPTPRAACALIPYLRGIHTFAAPCAGGGAALVRHLEVLWLHCVYAGDVATGQDALALNTHGDVDVIITNPPYTRPLIHAQIWDFARSLPTWLLIKTDGAPAGQAVPFTLLCSDIVLVGHLRHRGGGRHPLVATRGNSYAPRPE